MNNSILGSFISNGVYNIGTEITVSFTPFNGNDNCGRVMIIMYEGGVPTVLPEQWFQD